MRAALGLPDAWRPADGLSPREVRSAVTARLEPRERQALGLKYLGYSDKEMARLMGVKPNVPRSYLSAGKRKLGVPSGARRDALRALRRPARERRDAPVLRAGGRSVGYLIRCCRSDAAGWAATAGPRLDAVWALIARSASERVA